MPFLTELKTVDIRTKVSQFFNSDPIVDALPLPDMWALVEPLAYESRLKRCVITAPAGVTSDLASTPKFLQWIRFLDDDGMSRPCGILHDCMYRLGRERGKAFADQILREMCLDVGMTHFQANIYYLAVRFLGGSGWRQDGANAKYGEDPRIADFIIESDYHEWVAAGGTIYKDL